MIAVADQVRPTMPPLDRFVESRRSSIATFDVESQIDEQGLEYVNGGYQEKVMGWESEWIAGEILSRLREFVRPRQLGWVNGSNASYQCFAAAFPDDPDRFRKPDVSYVSMDRMPTFPRGHCKIAPDLAVEVISPNETYISMEIKIDEYLKVGVKLVWVVVPDIRTIHVYRLDGSSQTLRKEDALSGESILPGFHCPVMDVFPTVESRN